MVIYHSLFLLIKLRSRIPCILKILKSIYYTINLLTSIKALNIFSLFHINAGSRFPSPGKSDANNSERQDLLSGKWANEESKFLCSVRVFLHWGLWPIFSLVSTLSEVELSIIFFGCNVKLCFAYMIEKEYILQWSKRPVSNRL